MRAKALSDRELFELVYRRMRTLVPPQDPEFDDLVQIAATEVWRALPAFEERSQLSTFVYGVCYRVILNQRRFWRRFRKRFELGTDDTMASAAPNASDLLGERTHAEHLRTLLGRLSDKYRAVVVLHDLEGFSISEIADIVRANELTVRSRLRDGRRKLRQLLDLDPKLELQEA